jgi:hypothetical protein
MRSIKILSFIFLMSCLVFLPNHPKAYPVLDAVQGLPHPTLVTVYPDQTDPALYYFVPTSLEFAKDDNGQPRLGVQYWGLTGLDPDGSGAALTFSIRPTVDQQALDEIAAAIRNQNPNAKFAFPPLLSSQVDAILNSAFHDTKQDTNAPTSVGGGTVDATQAFSFALTNVGGRAFAQGASENADVLAARYTYRIRGIGSRLHARVTVRHKRVYDHFKATASGSAWWGMVRTSWSADWQKLVSDGSIELNILQGGETDEDAYMLTIFQQLVTARIGETGMFAPKLKPGGIVDAPEAGDFGWGFSGGGGWEHLEESVSYTFVINTQKLEEREFTIGISFSGSCARYPSHFADLTNPPRQCIDRAQYEETAKQAEACVDRKLARLQDLLNKGLISQAVWEREQSKVMEQPCFGRSIIAGDVAQGQQQGTDQSDEMCIISRLEAVTKSLQQGFMTAETADRAATAALNSTCSVASANRQGPLDPGSAALSMFSAGPPIPKISHLTIP